jgi:thiamine-monophosphate kinase
VSRPFSVARGHSSLGSGAEFDRIRSIIQILGERAGGLGDDCALISAGDSFLAISTDISVEQVHFRLDWIDLREAGWRSAAAALSDLAAEGAKPIGLLTAVTVPTGAPETQLLELMAGVAAAAEFTKAQVIGGDLSAGPVWSISVTVIGRVDVPITRAGAKSGDELWVTGECGGARVALETWRRGEEPSPAARARFAHPEPRIEAGQWLAAHGVRAMIDVSDGIGGDAGHLSAASGVEIAIDLDGIPQGPGVAEAAKRQKISAGQFAAESGEDYELLAVLPSGFEAQSEFARDCNLALTRIGRVAEGSGVHFLSEGKHIEVSGFNHFG